MNVAIHPCRGCPLREGCELRAEFRRCAKGIGAASVRFRCPILKSEVRPGRRIIIRAPKIDSGFGYPDGDIWEKRVGTLEVPATITHIRPDYSFAATVDFGAIPEDYQAEVRKGSQEVIRFRRVQHHYRIVRFLNEPDETLCGLCGSRLRDGQCDRKEGLSADCNTTAIELAGLTCGDVSEGFEDLLTVSEGPF